MRQEPAAVRDNWRGDILISNAILKRVVHTRWFTTDGMLRIWKFGHSGKPGRCGVAGCAENWQRLRHFKTDACWTLNWSYMSDMVGVPACLLLWWLFVIQRVQNKNVYCGDNGDSEGYSVIQIKSCVIREQNLFGNIFRNISKIYPKT